MAAYGVSKWLEGTRNGGQKPADPFRIAGNFYYVGTQDVASFLITDPQGDILIDGGYPGTPPMIMSSIKSLGFDIRHVKVLLNSEPHYDHAGGLADLQKASGAQLYMSAASAKSASHGGVAYDSPWPMRAVTYVIRYPAPRVDHIVKDGDTIRVGASTVTAHITGGQTSGCTSWTFPVHEAAKELLAVSACSLKLLNGLSMSEGAYPNIRADFEHSLATLRSIPADIWVTSHARAFDRYKKFSARTAAKDSINPFIDRQGYLDYIARGEASYRTAVAEAAKR